MILIKIILKKKSIYSIIIKILKLIILSKIGVKKVIKFL